MTETMLTILSDAADAATPSRSASRAARPIPAPIDAVVEDAIACREVVLDAVPVDVNARPAAPCAVLIVQPEGPDAFRITGAHSTDAPQDLISERIGAPSLALGDLAKLGGESPADIRYEYYSWSAGADAVAEWLEGLRAAADADVQLLIWDSSSHEIPWELFHLPGDPASGRPPGWLGALFPVARRVTLRAVQPTWDPWQLAHHIAEGRVLAMISGDMGEDKTVLTRIGPLTLTEHEVLEHLGEDHPDVGFLYIAAHGEFEPGKRLRMRLGGLGMRAVDECDLAALARARGVVFLNACHSGRLTWDVRQNNGLHGFAEVFLRKGAAAVLGVLGEVETGLANWVAAAIVEEMARRPGAPLAEIVRRLRAAAAAEAAGSEDTTTIKRFLYTFMYVVWGSPNAGFAPPTRGTGDD